MKNIAKSLAIIASVAAIVTVGTIAFFSDTEKSVNNKFTAGTIDISVDGQNPWTTSWENYLDKPCETNYMNFVIENVGVNPANVWKRLTDVVNGPGLNTYPESNSIASSEPEWEAGGGVNYVERDTLSAFMIYDMVICVPGIDGLATDCPLTGGYYDDGLIIDDTNEHARPSIGSGKWVIVIDEVDQVRVDNVVDTWIKLNDELGPGEKMVVSQSYHLMTWDDSGQPMVTNWAQGDTMEFDVELEARQLTAPAPGVNQANQATAQLVQKDTNTWEPVSGGATGALTYVVEGSTFDYSFAGTVVEDGEYQLIYYPDPWASNKQVVLIGNVINSSSNNVSGSGNVELNMDLPTSTDNNYGVGAKVWLVPTSSLSDSTLSWANTGKFLFDLTMVNYEDTDASAN